MYPTLFQYRGLTALLLTFIVAVRGDESYMIEGQNICLALTTSAVASSVFDCVMGQYTNYATKTLSGCSAAMLQPDQAATSDIYRCACSYLPVQISCIKPACSGDQLQRATSALSSHWCKATAGGAVTTTQDTAATSSGTETEGGATPTTSGRAGGTEDGLASTNTAGPAGGGGGGSGQPTTTTSRAFARETAVPVIGGALAAFIGLVAAAL